MDTEKNLKEAVAGESQANRKYAAFAKKADAEGYQAVARLFRAASEAEAIHAYQELMALGAVKTTVENLQTAIEGETYEFTHMYPEFIKKAEEEAAGPAKKAFTYANGAEKAHAGLYQKALAALASKSDTHYFLCTVCGYVHEDGAPDKCPVCGSSPKAFKNVG